MRKAEKKQPVPLWDRCVQNNHKTPQFSGNMAEDKVPSAPFHIDSRQYEFFSASKPKILKNIKKLFAYLRSNRAAGLVQQTVQIVVRKKTLSQSNLIRYTLVYIKRLKITI